MGRHYSEDPEQAEPRTRAEELRESYYRKNEGVWLTQSWGSQLFRTDTPPEAHLVRIRELEAKLTEAEVVRENKRRAMEAARTTYEKASSEVSSLQHEIDCRKLDMADKLGVPS